VLLKALGQIQLACDTCGEEGLAYDEDEFEAMISAAKGSGWKITNPGGRWTHTCPDCAETTSTLVAARKKFGIC